MNKDSKLYRILTSRYWRKRYFLHLWIFRFLPSEIWLKYKYKLETGKPLHLADPQSFNEKLQWLKVHDHNPLYTTLVDKYAVKQYIKNRLGEEYIIPLIGGPWTSVDDIDFDRLPNQFVLKCTHDSGGLVICRDKASLDVSAVKRKMKKALKTNFYYGSREWPYKNVKPRIIAEKYMENELAGELTDYKLMCFNSKVKAVFTCSGRFSENGLKVTFYNTDWDRLPFERYYAASSVEIEKPKTLEEMIRIAEILSENIPFVRIDFYEIQHKIYFGEFTFYPGSGWEEFKPESWDLKLGSWITLSNKNSGGLLISRGYVLWFHEYREDMDKYNKEDKCEGLTDYKFYCFNGQVKYLYVSEGLEDHDTAKISFLTPDWKPASFQRMDYRTFAKIPERPVNYEKMIDIAKCLSENMPFVRIDLFEINKKVYFSEFTFFPCSGFMLFSPDEWDMRLGNGLNIV